MTGLQHVNTFILYVSNRNSKKPKEQTCFALWASPTPTCLMRICISASDMEKKSLCLPWKHCPWLKRPSLPQNFWDSVKQHWGLALFSEIQWISCDQKVQKKTNPTKPQTYPIHWQPPLQEHNTRRIEEKIRWKGLPPIVFLTWKVKVFLEVSRHFIYIYIIYILFIALAINM